MKPIEKTVLLTLLLLICSLCALTPKGLAEEAEEVVRETEGWVFPAEGTVTDLFLTRGGSHKGIDIAGSHDSPVYAAADGMVMKAYASPTYGNVIMVRHENGYESVYAHLHTIGKEEGEKVHRGEEIGKMGNTGESSGTHLHFEIHRGEWTLEKENAIDPFLVFQPREIGHEAAAMERAAGPAVEASGQANRENAIYKVSSLSGDLAAERLVQPETELFYIVQKGDTLWSIAKRHSTTVSAIKELNDLDADLIIVMQELRIPGTPD